MNQNVYLMGIGGIGMANFAVLLKEAGYQVSGSDANIYEPAASILKSSGIPVYTPYSEQNLPHHYSIIIVGNALSRGHVEVEAALDAGTPLWSFPEFINRFILPQKHSFVVAGTHGKSTTTACLAHLLESAGQQPGFLIGAQPLDFKFGGSNGGGKPFVIEGDEYDTAFFDKRSKFLHYFPRTLILGTVEYDHADIFPTLEEMLLSFRRLINILPQNGCLIYSADCEQTKKLAALARCKTISVGVAEDADFRLETNSADLIFRAPDGKQYSLALKHPGFHNRVNALMALAAAYSYTGNVDAYIKGIESFSGIKRRLELLYKNSELIVYDDFAHHPTAIQSALQAVRESYPEHRIIAVCEPRSNTMVRNIFQRALVDAFRNADEIVFGQIHRLERIPEADRLDIHQLMSDLKQLQKTCIQIANKEIPNHLLKMVKGKPSVILFMSNGGFDGVQKTFLELLHGLKNLN